MFHRIQYLIKYIEQKMHFVINSYCARIRNFLVELIQMLKLGCFVTL